MNNKSAKHLRADIVRQFHMKKANRYFTFLYYLNPTAAILGRCNKYGD